MERLLASSVYRTLTALLIIHHFTTKMGSSLSTNPIPTNTDYIKNSCKTTMYPQLCYHSLSTYAEKIKTSPKLLATSALSVSLSAARSASNAMKKLSKTTNLKPRETAAMIDCVEELSSSVDHIRRSIQVLNHSGGSNFVRQMSDVETWVSAALTDDDTCMDGFAGKEINGQVRIAVRRHILYVAHLTSIALALVNNYAAS